MGRKIAAAPEFREHFLLIVQDSFKLSLDFIQTLDDQLCFFGHLSFGFCLSAHFMAQKNPERQQNCNDSSNPESFFHKTSLSTAYDTNQIAFLNG